MEMLSVWQTSDHFMGVIEKFGKRVPSEKLWDNPYKALREAGGSQGAVLPDRVR
jgi:hypothetical protein